MLTQRSSYAPELATATTATATTATAISMRSTAAATAVMNERRVLVRRGAGGVAGWATASLAVTLATWRIRRQTRADVACGVERQLLRAATDTYLRAVFGFGLASAQAMSEKVSEFLSVKKTTVANLDGQLLMIHAREADVRQNVEQDVAKGTSGGDIQTLTLGFRNCPIRDK